MSCCSKMYRCKACGIVKSEAYQVVRLNDERFAQRYRWTFLDNMIVERRGPDGEERMGRSTFTGQIPLQKYLEYRNQE